MDTLRVFMATPRDVLAERDRLGIVVRELSNTFSPHGLILELLDWRDVVPDLGRPEGIILEQLPVGKWDIFIGVLWARFGTPPGRLHPETGKPFLSGTEEEFTLALRSWRETGKPRILFYRCKRPIPPDMLDPEQFALVQKFFAEFKAGGEHPGLPQEYETVDDFERRVRQDLLKLLLEYSRGEKRPALESEVGGEVQRLEEVGNIAHKFRVVHNVLFCIRGVRYIPSPQQCLLENVLLLYYNEHWQMWLVPNTVDWPEKSTQERLSLLKDKLAGRLLIDPRHLVLHLRDDMKSDCVKPTRNVKLAQEYGLLTRFQFIYCPCEITEPYDHLRQSNFELHGIRYRWATLSELRSDPIQMEYNWDVITYLGVFFDISLSGLPLGIKGEII